LMVPILPWQLRLSIPASRQRDNSPHLFRSERPINRFLGCKATTKSHDPKNAVTFGALERAHLAPSSKRRNGHKYPCDIAVAAFALGIHGRYSFGRNGATLRRAVYVRVNFRDGSIPGVLCARQSSGRGARQPAERDSTAPWHPRTWQAHCPASIAPTICADDPATLLHLIARRMRQGLLVSTAPRSRMSK
jgi:hypothetical protein